MSYTHSTTPTCSFKHLTKFRRGQIEILLRQKVPKTKIAALVGISRSTLYYELKRGTAEQFDSMMRTVYTYFAETGQLVYEQRKRNSRVPFKLAKAYAFLQYVEEQIRTGKLSPDASRGKAVRLHLFPVIVSTKTIYNYIDKQLINVKNIDLPLRIRLRPKQRNCRLYRRTLGNSIELRDSKVDARTEFGHWEMDTVIGTRNAGEVLLVLDERVTRKRHMIKIANKTAAAVAQGLRTILSYYETPAAVFKSITCDNGSECSRLPIDFPDSSIYYAHPYAPFERGTNEKQNSLVRRFIPKGTDLSSVTAATIAHIERWINELPRKILNYDCADALFQTYLSQLS